MAEFHEPEIDPFEDTSPTNIVRPVGLDERLNELPTWRKTAGWLSLLGALGFTIATVVLLLSPSEPTPAPTQVANNPTEVSTDIPTEAPTDSPTTQPVQANTITESTSLPTLSPDRFAGILQAPVDTSADPSLVDLSGIQYDPFTVIPNRSRSGMISYTAERGDSISEIALQYGIEPESIAWCNDRRIAQVLRPGDVVNVPPTDGACHLVLSSQALSIQAIAERFKITDAYAIIDSQANSIANASPDTLLPSGTQLFIPGGEGEPITWRPPVEEDEAGNVIAFAPNQAGSCGSVGGGGTFWGNPLPNGTFVRGYYPGHTGIDISASTGTPVKAANGGPVLFAGWNSWGYGNTVVLGHGPFSTLYGHMSQLAVRCGDFVQTGQIIGYVGSTGNSSGPHLHFEIRFRNEPQNPSLTPGVGW